MRIEMTGRELWNACKAARPDLSEQSIWDVWSDCVKSHPNISVVSNSELSHQILEAVKFYEN